MIEDPSAWRLSGEARGDDGCSSDASGRWEADDPVVSGGTDRRSFVQG